MILKECHHVISHFVWANGRTLQIGNGKPGPVTNRLLEELQGLQFGFREDPFGWVRSVASQVRT